jgi:hypothetical protein
VIFTGKAYTGSSDDGSRTINNRSADTPWQLLIGRLLVGRVPHPLIFGTRHWSLLNGLAKADRRATQSGKRENYESRIKTESHEYFLSFAPNFYRDPRIASREFRSRLLPKSKVPLTEYKNGSQ